MITLAAVQPGSFKLLIAGELPVDPPEVRLGPLAGDAAILDLDYADVVPGDAAAGGRDAEEVVGVYRLDPQPDGHAVCGLGDVLLPEGHGRPGRDHIWVVVGEGDRITGRPVR